MRQQAPDLPRFVQIIRRYGALVGIAVAVGLLAGAVFAAFSPVMVTSTALIILPQSSPGMATAVVIARSNPVVAVVLPGVSPAEPLWAPPGDVKVKGLTPYVLSLSASARTAARAEATANAVAVSYVGYISSAGSPVGPVPALFEPATTATGPAPLAQVLLGAMLGVLSGALTGVTAALALASRRPARDPLSASRESGG